MTTRSFLAGAAAVLVSAPLTALGAGFQINEHSAPATGRGGAVFATIDTPSAIFYNPAGLANIEGTAFEVGLTMIRPRGEYTGLGPASTRTGDTPVTQSTEQAFVPVPNAYIARALSSKAFVGFGFYAPYGLGIDWASEENGGETASDFVGRTIIHELSLRTYFLTPAIALKLGEKVNVAVSVSLVPATVYFRRTLGATDNGQVLFPKDIYGKEGTVELAGSAFGVGANAGVQVSITDKLKAGLAFRSQVGLDFSGQADFEVPETAPAAIRANFPDQNVQAEITLPHAFALGLAWDDGPLTIEAAGNLTLWQSYEELRIDFPETNKPAAYTSAKRDWKPAPTLRLGGEYRFGPEDKPTGVVRAGVGYDFTPVPDETIDPTLPDNNRILASLGGGMRFGQFAIDIAYLAVILGDREANSSVNFAPGTWNGGLVHVIGASAGLSL